MDGTFVCSVSLAAGPSPDRGRSLGAGGGRDAAPGPDRGRSLGVSRGRVEGRGQNQEGSLGVRRELGQAGGQNHGWSLRVRPWPGAGPGQYRGVNLSVRRGWPARLTKHQSWTKPQCSMSLEVIVDQNQEWGNRREIMLQTSVAMH